MSRLFVAIDLPDPVRRDLGALCSGLPGARWVAPEQIHLTLRFIGEVDEDRAHAIRAGLTGIRSDPFDFNLARIGHFPTRGAPRVLWVGVEAPPALLTLQRAIESALVGLQIEPEDRPFSPHITLARFKTPPPPNSVRSYLDRHQEFRSPAIAAARFTLYSSTLTPQGPIYHQESVYPLIA